MGLLLLCAVGCGTHTAPDAGVDAGPQGLLVIDVAAPDGGTPAIQVSGPNSFSQTVHGSSSLEVSPGSYSITASLLAVMDPIAGQAYWPTVAGSPAAVAANSAAAVNVTYALDGASGRLWYPYWTYVTGVGYRGGVWGIPTSSLNANDVVNPLNIPLGDGGNVNSVAVDASGHVWAITNDTRQLYGWSIAPDGGYTTLAQISLTNPSSTKVPPQPNAWSLAFAPNGDVWITDYWNSALLRYSASQLATPSTATSPATVVTSVQVGGHPSLSEPSDLAFDTQGNLWVASYAGNSLTEYPNAGVAGISSTPTLVAVDVNACGFYSLAFDPAGNLWAVGPAGCDSSVYKYARPTGTGYVTLSRTATLTDLDGGAPFLSNVQNLAFDRAGSLWTSTVGNGIARIDNPSSYAGIAQPTASRYITTGLSTVYGLNPGHIQFDPPNPGAGQYPNAP